MGSSSRHFDRTSVDAALIVDRLERQHFEFNSLVPLRSAFSCEISNMSAHGTDLSRGPLAKVTDSWIDTVRHGADISPGPAVGEALAKGVGNMSPIGQENGAGPHGVEHVLGAAAVMSLPLGQLKPDRQT